MDLSATHPLYSDFKDDWTKMRDFYEGERTVKEKGVTYLPPTPGMVIDQLGYTTSGTPKVGQASYDAYKMRARVPNYTKEGVEILVGLMHQKEAVIELPPELEYLRTRATSSGESLHALHRRISVEQLAAGRLGLLVDLPENPDPKNPEPYIALYVAESIRNWDDDTETHGFSAIKMVVLDESGNRRIDKFNWKNVERYRVLELFDEDGTPVYKSGVFDSDIKGGTVYVESDMVAPFLRGKTLEAVPFTFINTKDLLPRPDECPLMGLANLCHSIYMSDADYRLALYMQSQDTLVVIGAIKNASGAPGEPDALRVGAGARIDCDQGGDAKYIGTSSQGLPEQRQALDTDHTRAQMLAGELVQSKGSQAESGMALSTRFTAQTATLNHIAYSGAGALENALKQIARWKGADESKVKVLPNMEFVDFGLDGQNLVHLTAAREKGFPLSLKSMHELAKNRGLTTMSFEDEQKAIEEENKWIEEHRVEPPEKPLAPGANAPKPAPGKTNAAKPAKGVQKK